MTADSARWRPAAGLTDRRAECRALGRLADEVRAGESRVLVVRGDPGVGKSVLLESLVGRAPALGCQVARATGVQSEMELAFAGLHQLCAPMLDHLERIPVPQHEALRTAFGVGAGPPPDRFLVGLGVLSLLSEVAGERPLICLVDDVQWLDRASVQTLGFTARRLAADPVGLVFGARDPGVELAGLPELEVSGLAEDDARALLAAALAGPLDVKVRDLIVAETRGNPLALLELPRGLSPAELAGGFGLPAAAPLAGRIEASFARQLDALPDQTRRLLALAAADPSGDRSLVWRAAARLGIPAQAAAAPAEEAGLAEFGARVRFRHPLARSAAYRRAPLSDRQQLHAALAQATDLNADPDRRAWHRACAAAGPDEGVAAELERSAGRAQARGGLAAAAAFLQRAVSLTADPARHTERTLAAAQASKQAGAFDKALDLLAAAEAGPLDEFASARVDLLRAQIAFATGKNSEAPSLLLKAAKRLEPLDLGLARETYVNAWMAANLAGRLAGAGDMPEISRAARALPPPKQPARPRDLLLEALSLLVTDGPAAAAPALRQAVGAFTSADLPLAERLQSSWMAAGAANALWDVDGWRAILVRQVQFAREAGALEHLPFALVSLAMAEAWRGDFAEADSLIAECDTVCEATGGGRLALYAALFVAALRDNQAEVIPLGHAAITAAEAAGHESQARFAHYATAILHNGLRRYADALAGAEQATRDAHLYVSMWALPELIEAAVRTGNVQIAADALERLAETTQAGGTDFGLGLEARCRALLSHGEQAGLLYREAIARLGRTRMRPELARAYLLYGEWLRRQLRHTDARAPLRAACQLLEATGMEGFAERARRELRAAGVAACRRAVTPTAGLTAQEAQIARLAAEGLSNPEIGARLFLSPRTVQYHLGKIFTKLDITSRAQLSPRPAPQLGFDPPPMGPERRGRADPA